MKRQLVISVSGPSGSGKPYVINAIKRALDEDPTLKTLFEEQGVETVIAEIFPQSYDIEVLRDQLVQSGCVFENEDIFTTPCGTRKCIRELHSLGVFHILRFLSALQDGTPLP